MTMQVQIGKGLTMDVDPSRFNRDVMDHVIKIGLRNLLMDTHAGATAKADPQGYIAKSRELAERKLQSLYNGIVRAAPIGGPKTPTDPVSMIVMRLARKAVQKDRAKDIANAPKDQRLAVLNKLATEYATAHDFVLVSTDSDFERLLKQFPGAKVVILRSCDYPTEIAADVLRRNAIRIADLPTSQDQLIILER